MDCVSNSHRLETGPQAWLIANETRLHLQHGPIDLIIEAIGEHADVRLAYKQAAVAFNNVLDCLAAQLSTLRRPYKDSAKFEYVGPVAARMQQAVKPLEAFNLTPMIAVAGAVADYILASMVKDRTLTRAQVNNGGDIAVYLSNDASVKVGICTHPQSGEHHNIIELTAAQGIGGIATSGWQGRSHSLGIANAVTVVSATAANADVAATLIANAVDLPGCAKITRQPACDIEVDSDLADRLVTTKVGDLSASEINSALASGESCAQRLMAQANVLGCFIHLQGQTRVLGTASTKRLLLARKSHAYS